MTAISPTSIESALPVKPIGPRIWQDDDYSAAHQAAIDEYEPVFVPASIYSDDRGWSMMNLLQGVMGKQGQVNYSIMYPGVVKAWHRHQKQADFWLVLKGNIKAGVYREDDNTAWLKVIGEKCPGILITPPTLWHGAATVGAEDAGLLYYVTNAYDPSNPDEERRAFDSVDGFPWSVRHG